MFCFDNNIQFESKSFHVLLYGEKHWATLQNQY